MKIGRMIPLNIAASSAMRPVSSLTRSRHRSGEARTALPRRKGLSEDGMTINVRRAESKKGDFTSK